MSLPAGDPSAGTLEGAARSGLPASGTRLELSPPLGGLKLMGWLVFQPSSWRGYTAEIDPHLDPGFALFELEARLLPDLRIRQVLASLFLVWPLMLAGLLALILSAGSRSLEQTAPGVFAGLAVYYAGLLVFGSLASLAAGAAGSWAAALLAGLGYGWIQHTSTGVVSEFVGGLAMVEARVALLGMLSGTFGLGLMAAVLHGLAGDRLFERPDARGARGIAAAGVVSLLVYLAMIGVVFLAGHLLTTHPFFEMLERRGFSLPGSLEAYIGYLSGGISTGALAGLAARLVSGNTRLSMSFGVLVGAGHGLGFALLGQLDEQLGVWLSGMLFGAAATAWVAAFYCLPFALARRFVSPGAGPKAGLIGVAGTYAMLSVLAGYPAGPVVAACLLAFLAGKLFSSWSLLLLYPLISAWNLILYALEARRGRNGSYLHLHPALCTGSQLLPWWGLDVHLLLTAERTPQLGMQYIQVLSTGGQRWAAQNVLVELTARRFEAFSRLEDIAGAHRDLAGDTLEGQANALLEVFRRFSRDVQAALAFSTAYQVRLSLQQVEKDLGHFLRELTLSSNRYAVRFYPSARNWSRVLQDHLAGLAAEIERRQEIDNPYIVSVPLNEDQEIFVGRTEIVARLEQLLLDRRRPPLLVYGQRRTGKTSLLRNLGRLLPTTYLPLFVDSQGISVASDYPDLLYSMAREISTSVKTSRRTLPPPPSRASFDDSPFACFNRWLDELEASLRAQSCTMALLMLDELEALERVMNKGRFEREDMLSMFRHIVQHKPFFKFLLASSNTIEEFQDWSGYLINVQTVKIGCLEPAEALQLVERPVAGFNLAYEPGAAGRIVSLTRGHPLLVQMLCYELVSLKNRQGTAQRRLARLSDVEQAVPGVYSNGRFFFQEIAQQAGPTGQAVLSRLAQEGECASLPESELRRVCPDGFDDTLALLLRRDLLEPVNEQGACESENSYRFQIELVRRWFHPA